MWVQRFEYAHGIDKTLKNYKYDLPILDVAFLFDNRRKYTDNRIINYQGQTKINSLF